MMEEQKEEGMEIGVIEMYLNSFPPGYKFDPSDDELIVDYLLPKINAANLPLNLMHHVNIYNYNPEQLAAMYSCQGNKGWYFFTPRSKKYRNGKRPDRKAGDGYWKATGADKVINRDEAVVGFRKALVFYKGRPPKGEKTLWIMHEFRIAGPSLVRKRNHSSLDDLEDTSMRLDDFILCRIYKKNEETAKEKPQEKQQEVESNESIVGSPTSSKDDISNGGDKVENNTSRPSNNVDTSDNNNNNGDHNVYNNGYNYVDTWTTSYDELFECGDPYQTNDHKYDFSEDLIGQDYYDNHDSILHLLLDPQIPTITYPYPDPDLKIK